MSLTVELVGHGRPAATALDAHLRSARGDDPLAPVTVVVPRSWVGISLRRLLASGALGGRPGLANVSFTTFGGLAADLARASIGSRPTRPLTDTALRAAVRATLRAELGGSRPPGERGTLAQVHRHPATERAVADAWRALRPASEASRRALARRSGRAAQLVRLCDATSARLAGHHDEHDVLRAAIAELGRGGAATTEPAVVLLLSPVAPREEELVARLAAARPVHVIACLTGDDAVDEPLRSQAQRLAGAPLPTPPVAAPRVDRVRNAPTPDTEVLLALRAVAARVDAGARLERLAVTYATPSPYAQLLQDAAAEAGIPLVGPSLRRLSQMVAGRALLGALRVREHGWSPIDVVALLATAPVTLDGAPVDPVVVDRVACDAGIVGSLDGWADGLERLDAEHAAERARHPADDRPGWLERRARDLATTRTLLEHLRHLTEPPSSPTSWPGWASWADRLLVGLLGANSTHGAWSSVEREAFATVQQRLAALAELDALDPEPDAERFRSALEAELDAAAPQTARLGTALLVGPIETVVGLDLDEVWILGCVDGALPRRSPDDALLPDDDRRAAGPDIPVLDRADEQRRSWLSALAWVPGHELSWSATDVRNGRAQRPARWLLDALAPLVAEQTGGRALYSRDIPGLRSNGPYEVVPSHIAAVASPGAPASLDDLDLRELTLAASGGRTPAGHWLAERLPGLRQGWEMRRSRVVGRYDRFEGRVRGIAVPSPVDLPALSPTRLEQYGACPRRYLLRHILRLEPVERPAALLEVEPRTKGSIVHAVLERFFAAEASRPPAERRGPDEPWGPDDHAALDRLADEVFAEFVDDGFTGHPRLWQAVASGLRHDLHATLDADSVHRATTGASPSAVELAFGPDCDDRAEMALSDGRTLTFKGRIDRVDATPDGRAIVFDYKTGSADGLREVADDPVKRGQALQLPLYGRVAARHLSTDQVEVGYWYVSAKGGFETDLHALDEVRAQRFEQVVEALVTSIEAGDFPARPTDAVGHYSDLCTFCDQRPACPETRERTWERVRLSPELRRLVEVLDTEWNPGEGSNRSDGGSDRDGAQA